MDYTLKEFDINTAKPSDWAPFHQYRKKYHTENTPDEDYFEDQIFEKVVATEFNTEEQQVKVFLIYVKDVLVGNLFFMHQLENSPSYKGNEDILHYKIELDRDYRGKGLGTRLLNEVVFYAKKYNKSMLITNSIEESGFKFLETIGSEIGLAMRENRLYLSKVDWNMIDQWIEEGNKLNPTTKLVLWNKVPDDYLERFCKTFTFAGNQSPRDNLAGGDFVMTPKNYRKREEEFGSMGVEPTIAVTIEQDGTISGLSELLQLQDKVIRQGLTAVLDSYRGRKLGKWLKAVVLKNIKEAGTKVEYISTTNAESNASMLAINNKLGFKKHKESINSQITLEKLTAYLQTHVGDKTAIYPDIAVK